MQIVIEIPEHDKNVIERFVRGDGCEDFPPSIIENLIRAIYLGTPLPKGHGRLIDADVFIDGFEDYYELCELVNSTPTIIEANKGEE